MWLHPPYVITCEELKINVQTVGDGGASTVYTRSVKQYGVRDQLLGGTGRGANAVHGCDLSGALLAIGLANGLALIFDLSKASDATPFAKLEGHAKVWVLAALEGIRMGLWTLQLSRADSACDDTPRSHAIACGAHVHTQVVGFLRFSHSASRLFTSSLDKSVRAWSLPGGECLQVIKAGTAVLQLAPVPLASEGDDAQHVLLACGDGTVRLWDPSSRKASKALSTLRYAHKEYVGHLRISPDGDRMLSISRAGDVQMWRRNEKHGFVPDPDAVPRWTSTDEFWRLDLLATGVLATLPTGSVELWPFGGSVPVTIAPGDADRPRFLDSPVDSLVCEWQTGRATANAPDAIRAMCSICTGSSLCHDADASAREGSASVADGAAGGGNVCCSTTTTSATAGACGGGASLTAHAAGTTSSGEGNSPISAMAVLFVAMRRLATSGADATQVKGHQELQLHAVCSTVPTQGQQGFRASSASSQAPAGRSATQTTEVSASEPLSRLGSAKLPEGWDRWRAIAEEEAVSIDSLLQQRLCIMEGVATKAGRELSESSVRAVFKRWKAPKTIELQ